MLSHLPPHLPNKRSKDTKLALTGAGAAFYVSVRLSILFFRVLLKKTRTNSIAHLAFF
jgi:hypothetical protein